MKRKRNECRRFNIMLNNLPRCNHTCAPRPFLRYHLRDFFWFWILAYEIPIFPRADTFKPPLTHPRVWGMRAIWGRNKYPVACLAMVEPYLSISHSILFLYLSHSCSSFLLLVFHPKRADMLIWYPHGCSQDVSGAPVRYISLRNTPPPPKPTTHPSLTTFN